MKKLPLLLILLIASCLFLSFSAKAQTTLMNNTVIGNANPCPGVPVHYTLSGINSGSGLIYTWLQSSVSASGPWLFLGNSASPIWYTLSPQQGPIWYTCITTIPSTAVRDTAEAIKVIPITHSACYCPSGAAIDSFSDIGQFSIGTLSNPIVAPPLLNNPGVPKGYSNFDTISSIPNFYFGQSYPVSVLAKFFQASGQNGWAKVYIDYNHNTSWDTPTENIFSSPISGPSYQASGNFTIPNTALTGTARLRVVYEMHGTATSSPNCGAYNYGETEDYVVNILAPGSHDPAVTNIQVSSNNSCLDSSNTIIVTLQNSGSQLLDLSLHPAVIRLNVRGPNGLSIYTDTLTSGFLQAFGANSSFAIFNGVNMHAGGNYTMNTDTISLIASMNTNFVNDSLHQAVTVTNTRPQNIDYQLCLGDTIPTGQGLGTTCPTNYLKDSVLIPFTLSFSGNTPPPPTQCAATGAGVFASGILPTLPVGANVLNSEINVTNLSLSGPTFPTMNLTRFSLYDGNSFLPTVPANIYHIGFSGGPSNVPFGCFDYVSTPSVFDINTMYNNGIPVPAGGAVAMGNWSTNRCNATTIQTNCGNPTVATLKIVYEYPHQGVRWYEQASGGVSISNASVLDPLTTPNNVVTNSNSPGTYSFFGACASDTNCRVETSLIVSGFEFSSVITDNVLCNGDSTGKVILNTCGGQGTVTYTLVPVSGTSNSSNSFIHLPAGSYSVIATDANNNSTSTNFIITEPPTLQVGAVSVFDVSCHGDSSGSVVLTSIGGSGLTTYALNPTLGYQAPAGTYGGLPANTYTAIGTDANGCMASNTFTITEPTSPIQITNITSTTPSCVPGNDAAITVTASGGTGALGYSIVGFMQPSNLFINIGAGVYNVTVTDANGCIATSTAIVQAPAAPTWNSVTSTNVLCYGYSSGSIHASVTPGTHPSITTNIVAPITIVSPLPAQNLPAGTYTIQAVDGNGCNIATIVNITSPPAIVLNTSSIIQPSCNQSNGSISIVGSGGTAPLTYSTPAPGNQLTPGHFTNLPAGSYTIVATDANGCSAATLVQLYNSLNLSPSNISITDILCHGNSTGSIAINPTPQTTYSLVPNWGVQTSPGNFINLPAGNYTITASDASNCSASTNVVIASPQAIQINIDSLENIRCWGENNGSILFNAAAGVPPYSYSVNNGLVLSNGFVNNLAAGSYVLRAIDYNGCTQEIITTISEPNKLQINTSIQHPICSPKKSGVIYITGIGGTPPYSYYHGGIQQVGPYPPFLDAGQYEAKIVDAKGCTTADSVELIDPIFHIDSVLITPKTCKNIDNGFLQVNHTNTSGNPTIQKFFDAMGMEINPSYQRDSGEYVVVIYTNTGNCSDSQKVRVPYELKNHQLDAYTITKSSCNEVADGLIVFNRFHTPLYDYNLQPNLGDKNFDSLYNLPGGQYILTGEDEFGCQGIDTIEVGVIDNREFFYTTTQASNVHCYGSINAQASGGVGAYTYNISPKMGREESSGYFDGLCWGDYTLTATDSAGCAISEKITILEDPNAPRNMFHHMIVYPNPADNEIWIKSNYLIEYTTSLISLTGQCVYTNDFHDKLARIPVDHLSPGIYILRMKSAVDHYERKVIIR